MVILLEAESSRRLRFPAPAPIRLQWTLAAWRRALASHTGPVGTNARPFLATSFPETLFRRLRRSSGWQMGVGAGAHGRFGPWHALQHLSSLPGQCDKARFRRLAAGDRPPCPRR